MTILFSQKFGHKVDIGELEVSLHGEIRLNLDSRGLSRARRQPDLIIRIVAGKLFLRNFSLPDLYMGGLHLQEGLSWKRIDCSALEAQGVKFWFSMF